MGSTATILECSS